MEEGRNTFKILAAKPKGKRSLGRPDSRWEDNIRLDLKEIGINIRHWIDSAQDMYYGRALELPNSISHGVKVVGKRKILKCI